MNTTPKNNLPHKYLKLPTSWEVSFLPHFPELLVLFFTGIVYVCLHGIYSPVNVDDAWSLSFAYNFLFKHIGYDLTFGSISGGCGVQYFGKTYAYIYGLILNCFGWTKSNALFISTSLILVAVLVWYFIVHQLTRNKKVAVWFCILMLIIEPFFRAANEARPDALTFLLVSAAFLAFLSRKTFWAGLIAMVAIEVHPLGIISLGYILAAQIYHLIKYGARARAHDKTTLKKMLFFLGGLGVGIVYYVGLHFAALSTITHEVMASNSGHRIINNFIIEYFLFNDFGRHMPELLLSIIVVVFFVRRKFYREDPYCLILLIILPCITLLIKRPNFRYIVYLYPVFLLLILQTFQRLGRLRLAIILFIILLIPPYTVIFYNNHGYQLNKYLNKLVAAVPKDSLPIVGGSNDWFVFKERVFYAHNYNGRFHCLQLKGFYLIENQKYRSGEYPCLMKAVKELYSERTIAKFRVNHELFKIKLEQRLGKRVVFRD